VPSTLAGTLLSIWGGGPYFEVGGTPTIVPSSMLEQLLKGPEGLEFETFTVFAMRRAGLEMLRLPASFGQRSHGTSHWNKGLGSQLSLLYSLLRYVTRLRKNSEIPAAAGSRCMPAQCSSSRSSAMIASTKRSLPGQ
jgi:hypothetical protein